MHYTYVHYAFTILIHTYIQSPCTYIGLILLTYKYISDSLYSSLDNGVRRSHLSS